MCVQKKLKCMMGSISEKSFIIEESYFKEFELVRVCKCPQLSQADPQNGRRLSRCHKGAGCYPYSNG